MVIVRLTGGLGNQLFQYAFGRALAEQHGVTLKVDRYFLDNQRPEQGFAVRPYALDLFAVSPERASEPEVARYVPLVTYQPRFRWERYAQRLVQRVSQYLNPGYIIETTAAVRDPAALTAPPTHCYLAGYWQSERYFAHIGELLRSELRFRRPLEGRAAALGNYIASLESVCIHVRRTDFLTDSRQTTLTPEQIAQGVAYLIRQGIEPTLFVFSDDIDWCRQHIKSDDAPLNFVSEQDVGRDAATHFQLMTRCRYFILSVSTFGWWAAWLADHPTKIVLHPPHPYSANWAADGWIDLSTINNGSP